MTMRSAPIFCDGIEFFPSDSLSNNGSKADCARTRLTGLLQRRLRRGQNVAGDFRGSQQRAVREAIDRQLVGVQNRNLATGELCERNCVVQRTVGDFAEISSDQDVFR